MEEQKLIDEIYESLIRRAGMEYANESLLKDMITDVIAEVKDEINYKQDEDIPVQLNGVIKEIVLTRYNLDGTQGIASESQSSGGSTTYLTDLPPKIKQKIRRCRRLRR